MYDHKIIYKSTDQFLKFLKEKQNKKNKNNRYKTNKEQFYRENNNQDLKLE